MSNKFKFQLGEVVKDKITGFEGVVIARAEYASGCLHYGVESTKLKPDGTIIDWLWIDQGRLESTGKIINIIKDDSGPSPNPPMIN